MIFSANAPVLTAKAASVGMGSTVIMMLLFISVIVWCIVIKAIKNDSAKQNQRKAPTALEKADKLNKLKELLDANVITQEEFNDKKKDILK